jgi:hypothetical protein
MRNSDTGPGMVLFILFRVATLTVAMPPCCAKPDGFELAVERKAFYPVGFQVVIGTFKRIGRNGALLHS